MNLVPKEANSQVLTSLLHKAVLQQKGHSIQTMKHFPFFIPLFLHLPRTKLSTSLVREKGGWWGEGCQKTIGSGQNLKVSSFTYLLAEH